MYSSKKSKIIAVGDVFINTKSGTLRPFSTEIETFFQSGSCVLINLETVLIDNGQPQKKAVPIRTNSGMANYLQETGISVVNLANNHSLDYGLEGFEATLSALDAAEVEYIGVLHDGKQKPFLFQENGCKFGILGYTIGCRQNYASPIARVDEQEIIQNIRDLKSEHIDRVIINMHWGEEYVAYPSPEQQQLARSLIDHGADVIIGHHPHVVQGIEIYKSGVIFYSLGNFNFMNSRSLDQCFPSTQWGLIALLDFSAGQSVNYHIIPVQIDMEYRPRFAPKDEEEAFLAYIRKISKPLRPNIEKIFWLREAAWPHFRNNIPSFFQRIKRYGLQHFYQMLRWLISTSNYGFYLGLILGLIARILGRSIPKTVCPKPRW